MRKETIYEPRKKDKSSETKRREKGRNEYGMRISYDWNAGALTHRTARTKRS